MAPPSSSNFRNRDTFPPFSSISNENELHSKYWRLDHSHSTYLPRRHWCLLGEIVANTRGLVRLCLTVRDMRGRVLPIYFHTDDRGESIRSTANIGCTVAVLYAEQHYFMDGDSGLRIETMEHVKIIPHSLSNVYDGEVSHDGEVGHFLACDNHPPHHK